MIRRHAEIAGAGLAGLALAAALARDGWSVRVHEAGDAVRSTGGGLYVTEDGFRTVRALDAYDDLMEGAFFPSAYVTRVDGELRSREANDGHAYCTMLRNHLHGTLRRAAEAAGIEVVTGSRAVGAHPDGMLLLESGERCRADLVVGADGVGSRLAESLGIAVERRRFDDIVIRVLLDRAALSGEEWSASTDLWSYRERKLRVLCSPCSPRHCYLVMMAPVEDAEAAALPIRPRIWSEAFPELAPILDQSLAEARQDRYGTIRLDRWSRGRAAIVGDAAHAMPSSIGKGASLGMWNAVTLARHLREQETVEAALALWETERRPVIADAQGVAERVALSRTLSGDRPAGDYEVPLVRRAARA